MLRKLTFGAVFAGCVGLSGGAMAQDATLTDLRSELVNLNALVNTLRGELSASGQAQPVPAGGDTIARVDAIEAALARLTSQAETLENRVTTISQQAQLQLGDLNFRLCELEPGCDIGNLPQLATLDAGATNLPLTVTPEPVVQLAAAEQADYDFAKAAYDAADYQNAANLLDNYAQTYPGSPLAADAQFLRGEALSQLGLTSDAARAYLGAYTAGPDGTVAPDALYKLGKALGDLGQTAEACVTLDQVGLRYPGTNAATGAQVARAALGCS